MRLLRNGFMILAVFSCHVQVSTQARQNDLASTARQLAAAANDKADSLEERRAALVTLEEATRLFLRSGEMVEAARALNRVGRLHFLLSDPNKAIESHERALALLDRSPSNEVEVDNLNGLGASLLHLTKFELAEKALRRSIGLSEGSGYRAGEAEALVTLSEIQNLHQDHAVALETGQKALAKWEAIGDKAGLASAYVQVGGVYLALQRLDESKQSYEKAHSLWSELRNPGGQADALIAIGFIEYRRGDWQAAINYHTDARGLLDDRSDPMRVGQTHVGMGEAFVASGMLEVGLGHHQRGLEYYRQTQRPDYIAYTTVGIGRTYYLLGNYSEAINQIQSVLRGERKDSQQAAQCHEFLARAYLAMGNYDVALEHLEIALPIYERAVNPKEVAQVLSLKGQAYQQQGDVSRARQNYQKALGIFTRLADRMNLAVIFFAIGRLELKQENLAAAESYLRQSIEVTEDMRRASTMSDLTAAFSATASERYESYIECLMRRHNAQPGLELDVRAFESSEMSRGRALVEVLRATQSASAPGLDPQLAAQEKSLRQSLRVREDSKVRLLAGAYKQEVLAAAEADIAQLELQYKQVLETIRTRYPSFEQINRPTGWKVRQIQEQVVADDETLLLEYSLGADRSYVWAVTRDRITSYELPSQAVINEAAQKVYRLLSKRPDIQTQNELDHAAEELSRMVLSPVAKDLNKRRILIVADGALNYIPFQFLPSPIADRGQLLAAHEIINAPSASILGQLRQETSRRQPATNLLAAFGDPEFAANYAQSKEASGNEQIASVQTPYNDRLREALRDIELNGDSLDPSVIKPLFYAKLEMANLREVAGEGTLFASGFDATREKLQHTDLTKFSILHFATHGFLNPKRPEKSGLILSTINRNGQSQEGFFGLSDIYNLHAPVDLVVLSACRTGLGKDVRGEGLIGITRGFMYAGASSVVASLWKVDDEATAELMKRFYTNLLKGGMTPAAALGAAQNSIRRQKEWSSPYYWAAFTIQGDSRHVIRTARTSTTDSYENMIAVGALLALMIVVGASYRRHMRGMTNETR